MKHLLFTMLGTLLIFTIYFTFSDPEVIHSNIGEFNPIEHASTSYDQVRETKQDVRSNQNGDENDIKHATQKNNHAISMEISNIISNLDIPSDYIELSRERRVELEKEISNAFTEGGLINIANDNDLSSTDIEALSNLLDIVTKIRAKLINESSLELEESIKNYKLAIENGDVQLPIPKPLSSEQISVIEGAAYAEYQAKMERARIEREALLSEQDQEHWEVTNERKRMEHEG